MNHFKISIIKSILRIISCVSAFIFAIFNLPVPGLCILGGGLAIAELLGILEEIFDKRKE